MRIGAHESIAGGVHRAFERGLQDGCEALQLFTSSNMQWRRRPLDDEDASLFLGEADYQRWPLLSHAGYLINLASPSSELRWASIDALSDELDCCETLGIDAVVVHPGAHMGEGVARGLRRIGWSLAELARRSRGYHVRLLLENTAGQGSCLGHRFEQLGRLLEANDRLGVCVDTCHAFAAGYDLRDSEGYESTLAELDAQVGLDAVQAFHLNDCKRELGSRVDRHASIGEGEIGLESFRLLVNDARFAALPAVVETPADGKKQRSFARNIRTLKDLRVRH